MLFPLTGRDTAQGLLNPLWILGLNNKLAGFALNEVFTVRATLASKRDVLEFATLRYIKVMTLIQGRH